MHHTAGMDEGSGLKVPYDCVRMLKKGSIFLGIPSLA